MVDDPLVGYGLQPVNLADRAVLDTYFGSLREPLSDYTFSQLFSWRNSLRILWRQIEGHLCVFANGTGDLTLLMPPIGSGNGGGDRALRAAWEVMDAYNADHGVPQRSRVEYASAELLQRFDRAGLNVRPMGCDYLYDVGRMIDLAGGDLASKRQAKNRFCRNYAHRVEPYSGDKHFEPCCQLLDQWKQHQDQQHATTADSAAALKRQKESLATRLSLECAGELGYQGIVVYVSGPDGRESIRGFTFGEWLGSDQSSIVIEKTDLEIKGLAQFIFSEFCRTCWAARPLVNVGDDWGLETLAWTKTSYRPVKLLQKHVLTRPAVVQVASGFTAPPAVQAVAQVAVEEQPVAEAAALQPSPAGADAVVRAARKEDLDGAIALEQNCFDTYCLTKRQLQYHQQHPRNVFLVAEHGGEVVGEGIALVRQHKHGMTGRIYSLAVSPDHRRRKLGRRMLQQMIDELTTRGVRRVYLEVQQDNRAAIQLYRRLGFRQVGVLSDYYGAGRHGVHMLRDAVEAQEPSLFGAAA